MIEIKNSSLMQNNLDNLWLKMRVTAMNISNIDTPGYKSKEVKFKDFMDGADGAQKAEIVTNDKTSLREDGNNVDIDREGLELYRVQIQYEYMIRKISDEFSNIRTVLTEGRR
jgi:Flagellar basal body protein